LQNAGNVLRVPNIELKKKTLAQTASVFAAEKKEYSLASASSWKQALKRRKVWRTLQTQQEKKLKNSALEKKQPPRKTNKRHRRAGPHPLPDGTSLPKQGRRKVLFLHEEVTGVPPPKRDVQKKNRSLEKHNPSEEKGALTVERTATRSWRG